MYLFTACADTTSGIFSEDVCRRIGCSTCKVELEVAKSSDFHVSSKLYRGLASKRRTPTSTLEISPNVKP